MMPGRAVAWVGGVLAVGAALANLSAGRERVYGRAVDVWRDTVAERPTSPRAWANLGLALLDRGPAEDAEREARRCLEQSIALDATGVFGHVELAILLRESDPGRAAELCREVIRRRPRDARAHQMLARLLVAADPAEAERLFEIAARLAPQDADCLVNLANMKLLRGDASAAIEIYDRVLAIAPEHPLARANRQQAVERLGGG
jgi:tetratricopeptide (TPR) repeat protein